jgi:CheY-like chemotaxis protein
LLQDGSSMETMGTSDRQASVAQEQGTPAAIEAVEAVASVGTRGLVLIVEDDDATRDVYAQLLRLLGYQVEEASAGLVGIERARVMQPDLILMDIGLPEVSGWAAARVLRGDAATSQIPLLAFSASIDSHDALRSVDEGGWFDGFVTKPTAPTELAERVAACIEARRLRRASGAAA